MLQCRSVKNRSHEIVEYIADKDIDVCSISETWLSSGERDSVICGSLAPDGYNLLDVPHVKGRRGSVAVIYKNAITVKKQKVTLLSSFECMEIIITAGNEVVRLAIIYRPLSSCKSGQPASVFLEEFYHYVDNHATKSKKLLVVGDFNFHFEVANNQDNKKFQDALHSLNLEQHVYEPTHSRGHILDLVITRCAELTISDLQVDAPVISDHGAVSFCLPLSKPPATSVTQTFCKLKNINIESFQNDILNSTLYTSLAGNVNDFVDQYDYVLKEILDTHASEKTKKVQPSILIPLGSVMK